MSSRLDELLCQHHIFSPRSVETHTSALLSEPSRLKNQQGHSTPATAILRMSLVSPGLSATCGVQMKKHRLHTNGTTMLSAAPSAMPPFCRGSFPCLLMQQRQQRAFTAVPRFRAAVDLPDLKADDFSHPLDRQNTTLLRAIPGLNELGKLLLGPVAEQVMLLENIGTSILVSEDQLPQLHKLLIEAARILNLEAPELYIRQNPTPNAYTLAMSGRKPFIVLHTGLVELLTPSEIQAVIAHELGHLKCDHGLWLTFANILALGAYSLPGLGVVIAQTLEEQIMRWLRAAELTCDRAALLVTQDSKVVVSVLMKLSGGSPSLADQLNVDAFLKQAHSYDKASSSPLGWYLRNAQTRQLSHPLPVLRAREIDNWSRSPEYKNLIARAVKLSSQKSNS